MQQDLRTSLWNMTQGPRVPGSQDGRVRVQNNRRVLRGRVSSQELRTKSQVDGMKIKVKKDIGSLRQKKLQAYFSIMSNQQAAGPNHCVCVAGGNPILSFFHHGIGIVFHHCNPHTGPDASWQMCQLLPNTILNRLSFPGSITYKFKFTLVLLKDKMVSIQPAQELENQGFNASFAVNLPGGLQQVSKQPSVFNSLSTK